MDWATGGLAGGRREGGRCCWGISSPRSLVVGCVLTEGPGSPPSSQILYSPSPGHGLVMVLLFLFLSTLCFLLPARLCTGPSVTLTSVPSTPPPQPLPCHCPLPTVIPGHTRPRVSWTQQALSPTFCTCSVSRQESPLSPVPGKPQLIWRNSLRCCSPLSGKLSPSWSWLLTAISQAEPPEEGTGPCPAL